MTSGSVISRGAVVRGNVRGEGSLEILGRVEGDVNVEGDVIVGESGVVRGNITAAELSVSGTVQGDLRGAQGVLLERGARVVGDLSAPRIGVAPGALVRGTVRTDGEPALASPVRRGATATAPLRAAAPAAVPAAKPFVAKEAPKPQPVLEPEPLRRERDSAPRFKESPPAPVVPALGKGAKAKKKRREA